MWRRQSLGKYCVTEEPRPKSTYRISFDLELANSNLLVETGEGGGELPPNPSSWRRL